MLFLHALDNDSKKNRIQYQNQTGFFGVFKEYLAYIGRVFFEAQPLPVNNIFDLRTQNAVKEFQRIFELPQTGQVDETTWNTIADVYRTLRLGQQRLPGQYPGRELKEG